MACVLVEKYFLKREKQKKQTISHSTKANELLITSKVSKDPGNDKSIAFSRDKVMSLLRRERK